MSNITTAQQAAEAAISAQDLSSGMGGHGSAYRAAKDAQRYARMAEELAGPDDAEWVFRAQAAEGRCHLAREYYDGRETDLARPWPVTHPGITVAIFLPEDQLEAITEGQLVWTAVADEKGMELEEKMVERVEKVTAARITTSWGNPDGPMYLTRHYRRRDGRLVGTSRDKRPRTIYRVEG